MKKYLLLIFLVGFFGLSLSQDYYQIKSLGHNYSDQTIRNAFKSADFCGSHFESKRNKIVFDDGAIVELKSKVELLNEGIQILNSCVISDALNYQIYINILLYFTNITYLVYSQTFMYRYKIIIDTVIHRLTFNIYY